MLEIEVWDWRGPARNEGKAAEAWLSSYLGRPCRLLRYMGGLREGERKEDRARRPAGNSYQWAHPNVFCDGSWLDQTDVTFPDQFPLLIANEASLADLNRQMQDKVPMNRFRPNIVIAGAAPWAEDAWASLTVVHKTGGGTLAPLAIHSIAPCSRCKVACPAMCPWAGSMDITVPCGAMGSDFARFALCRNPNLVSRIGNQIGITC
eukprot:jgi/Botrbrau1/17495/Bobra.0054s0077.6